MKIHLEYTVDESVWGSAEDFQKMTDEEKIEIFLEDPIELIHKATWSFDFK